MTVLLCLLVWTLSMVAADARRWRINWTAAQVAQFPGRLVGFCGLSPLKDYAVNKG